MRRKQIIALCATGITSLFNASVPEKIIQKKTGHSSLNALRSYAKDQQEAVTRVMMARDGQTFEDTVAKDTQDVEIPKPSFPSSFFNSCSIGNVIVNINPTITQSISVEDVFSECLQV